MPSLRQIMRYLRSEGTSFGVRLELGRLKIVASDLIPLLLICNDTSIVFELVLRLMLNLTQPAIVCFHQEIPKEKDMCAIFMKLDEILKDYKRAFANKAVFEKLANKITVFLERESTSRSEDEKMMIERIIILVRNILHISDVTEDQKIDDDISIHDQIIKAMHSTGWEELLLYFSNGQDETSPYAFHTLEVISLLLKEQTPESLASAGKQGNATMDSSSKILERHLLREKDRQRSVMFDLSARNNRFGATYELKNYTTNSKKSIIYHHDITKSLIENKSILARAAKVHENHPSDFDQHAVGIVNLSIGKKIVPQKKNKKPLLEQDKHRKSTISVRLHLQKFCSDYLKFCYNSMMSYVRGALQRHMAQANDETYFLWTCKFFMGFARLHDFKSDLISETLNMATYQFIYDQAMGYRDAMQADRKGGPSNQQTMQNSRRLALAVSTLREFLTCVQLMSKYQKPKDMLASEADESTKRLILQKDYAETLMANIFYMEEYQTFFPTLFKDYNEATQTRVM
ncbi:hypothetical protein Ciccas_002241 [Cichlidogyrus casuarinus]|uniref:Timeless N-terminal domain-containing protein n=1 Tax=Cichlidogyrus casuarinus TaxID=1844966 RepID=A0ABD2QID6_9PLAT